jgi:hypothetical protein
VNNNQRRLLFTEGEVPEGTPWKKERQEAGNGLLFFPVSGSRIPKIPDFC